MNEKTLEILEFHKVLSRLAGFAAFSASQEMARGLKPTRSLEEALHRQAVTTEAGMLLSVNDSTGIGGAVDIRPLVNLAERGGVLTPAELLDVKTTLVAARDLSRVFDHSAGEYPLLHQMAGPLSPGLGLVDVISAAFPSAAK